MTDPTAHFITILVLIIALIVQQIRINHLDHEVDRLTAMLKLSAKLRHPSHRRRMAEDEWT